MVAIIYENVLKRFIFHFLEFEIGFHIFAQGLESIEGEKLTSNIINIHLSKTTVSYI